MSASVDVIKRARAKKEREIAKLRRDMIHKCNEMKHDIEELENTCVVTGADCNFQSTGTGSRVMGTRDYKCRNCERYVSRGGGKRKRKRKTRKRRRKSGGMIREIQLNDVKIGARYGVRARLPGREEDYFRGNLISVEKNTNPHIRPLVGDDKMYAFDKVQANGLAQVVELPEKWIIKITEYDIPNLNDTDANMYVNKFLGGRRKKKTKKRRRKKKTKRRKKRTKRRRRKRTRSRKGGWSPDEEERLNELQQQFDYLWDLYEDIYIQALQQMSYNHLENQDWEKYSGNNRNNVMHDADIIIPVIGSWGIEWLKFASNPQNYPAGSLTDEMKQRHKDAIIGLLTQDNIELKELTKKRKKWEEQRERETKE